MRILHIETRHRRGGAERNALHTANWQRRKSHTVEFAVGHDSLLEDFPAEIPVHVVDTLVRNVHPSKDLQAVAAIRWLIRRGRYDLVHTHQSKAGILGRLAARGLVPRIVHTVHMASFGPSYGRLSSAIFRAAERAAASSTDVIVAVGEELRDMYLAAGVGRPAQYEVIHSPIDIESFLAIRSLDREARASATKALGVRAGRPVAVVIASLERRKRVDLIVRHLARPLAAEELMLVIAGDGDQRQALVALVESLGLTEAVRLLGHVDDLRPILAAANVVCHAATVEGVPQVVVQALAAGVPVVATEMIGLAELRGEGLTVVAADGAGFSEAVWQAVVGGPARHAATRFDRWTALAIEDELNRLHARLSAGLV